MKKVTIIKKLLSCMIIVSMLMGILIIKPEPSYAEEDNLPSRFNVREVLEEAGTPLVVKNQYRHDICYWMAASTVVEAHIKYKKTKGEYSFITETPVYSVLEIAGGKYETAISLDKVEPILKEYFNDETMTEDKLLSEYEGDNFEEELLNRIRQNQPQFSVAKSDGSSGGAKIKYTKAAGSVYKRYEDGVLKYYDEGFKNEITKDEADKRMNEAKRFIYENGAVKTGVQSTYFRAGNNGIARVCNAKDRTTDTGDHEITIVGWDDNFSKDNFPDDIKPSEDGAWIAQNSWGSWGDNGLFYISYEDLYAQDDMFGIKNLVPYSDVDVPEFELDVDKVNHTVKVEKYSDNYGSGIDLNSFKYAILDHNIPVRTDDDIDWKSMTADETIHFNQNQYVFIMISDKAGNKQIEGSSDNGTPLMLDIKQKFGKWRNEDITIRFFDGKTMVGLDPEDFTLVAASDTVTEEEFRQMETIDSEDKSHTITFNKEGKHTVFFTAWNPDNNEEYRGYIIVFMLDKTAPKNAKIDVQGTEKDGKYGVGAKITITDGVDTISGLASTEISVKDGNGNEVELSDNKSFKLDKAGTYTITVTCTDQAGNSSTETKTIIITDEYESDIKEDTNNNEKEEDKTKSDKVLPNTGSKCIAIFIIIGLALYAIRSFNKYKRLYK